MSRIYEAIRRAQESRLNRESASEAGIGILDLPDRASGQPWEFPVLDRLSSEAPVDFAATSTMTLDSAVEDNILIAPSLPKYAPEIDPCPPSDEGIIDANAYPAKGAVEALQMAFSHIIHDCIAETAALRTHEMEEEAENIPAFFPRQNAAGAATFPMLETHAAAEPIPFLAAEGSLARISASTIQEAAEEVSRTELVSVAKEKPAPSSFMDFYGLHQQPFDVTPDPDYLYLSRSHREALTSLSQGVENLRGFIALVANPGLGKTTVLNKLTEELGDGARVVHLFHTQCNSTELLGYLLSELGVDYEAMDVVAMHRKLNSILFREMLEGRRFVLIVDEAQNLQEPVLETIRLLSDFETTHSKLIQIILAGQPQLVQTLRRPGLSQLRQRIGIVATLKSLDAAEVAEYVDHRLRTAGSSRKSVFSRDALNLIAKQSEGAPRSINNLCFNALILGYSMRQEIIGIDLVEKVAKQMDLEEFA